MNKQIFQEEKYNFNYHYIPEYQNNNFKHFKVGAWFLEYMGFIEHLKEYLKNYNFSNLIEVGCGDGRIISELSKKFKDKKFTGIDISKKAIDYAKYLNIQDNLIYKHLDVGNCKEKFDVILLIEVFEHIAIEERKKFLESIKIMMNDNTILIVTVPHKNRKLDPRHYEHFTLHSFKEAFKDFHLIEHKFLAKKSLIVKFFYTFLENKYFILSHQKLLNKIFSFYKKRYLIHTNEDKALRIFGVFKK